MGKAKTSKRRKEIVRGGKSKTKQKVPQVKKPLLVSCGCSRAESGLGSVYPLSSQGTRAKKKKKKRRHHYQTVKFFVIVYFPFQGRQADRADRAGARIILSFTKFT